MIQDYTLIYIDWREMSRIAIKNYVVYLSVNSKDLTPFSLFTEFKYSNLKVKPEKITLSGKVRVSVDVENVGRYNGDEVVQLYLRDVYSSISKPFKELKRYKRITLKPGEKRRVEFTLTEKELGFLNENMEWVVEKGDFEVMVGGDSLNLISEKFEFL